MDRKRRVLRGASCLAALLAGSFLQAGEPDYRFVWVKTLLGPCCGDSGEDLAVDGKGAVFVAGHRGGLDLDRDGSVDVQTLGSPDSLVFKAVGFENEAGWVGGPGGPKPDRASGVAPDGRGGVYVVGTFEESLRVGGQTIRSAGRRDGYVVRYGEDGEPQWALAIGGEADDWLHKVAADAAGHAYVIGTVRGAIDVDRDGTVDVTASGESGVLLASFDRQGTVRWVRTSKGSAAENGRDIVLGPGGELYIGGHFRGGTLDLDGDGPDGPAAADGKMNGYFARLNSSGERQWVQVVTGADLQVVGSLAVAGNGDLLVLGAHSGPVDLDGDGAPDVAFRSLGDRRHSRHEDFNAFLARLTPHGKRVWARRYAAAVDHVAADATRIAVSGSYTGPLDLDDDGRTERTADPDDKLEGFVAILDGQGGVRHVFTVVGDDSDVVRAAGFTPDGKGLYATGYTKLGADFDGDGEVETASQCHQLGDVFLAFYAVDDEVTRK